MKPEVTVVIPYYNESKNIKKTLSLIAKQSSPAKEAIFVNSSSTDDSFLVVNDWINENILNFSFFIVSNLQQGLQILINQLKILDHLKI